MRECPNCSGFVPEGKGVCPHCDRVVESSRIDRAVQRLARGALAVGASMTLMACYGGPVSDDDFLGSGGSEAGGSGSGGLVVSGGAGGSGGRGGPDGGRASADGGGPIGGAGEPLGGEGGALGGEGGASDEGGQPN